MLPIGLESESSGEEAPLLKVIGEESDAMDAESEREIATELENLGFWGMRRV